MGFFRHFGLACIGLVLFFSILFSFSALTFAWSLDYALVAPTMNSILTPIVQESGLLGVVQKNITGISRFCINATEYTIPNNSFNVNSIPCSISPSNTSALSSYIVNQTAYTTYYYLYDCTFTECLQREVPLVLVSKVAQDYWYFWFYKLLGISFLLLIGAFFLLEKKRSIFFFAGIIIFFASIPFFSSSLFISIGTMILNFVAPISDNLSILSEIFALFFSAAHSVFYLGSITGVSLILVGIILVFSQFWISMSMRISNLFQRKDTSSENEKRVVTKKK